MKGNFLGIDFYRTPIILNIADSDNPAIKEFRSCCEKNTDEQQENSRLMRIKTNVV